MRSQAADKVGEGVCEDNRRQREQSQSYRLRATQEAIVIDAKATTVANAKCAIVTGTPPMEVTQV